MVDGDDRSSGGRWKVTRTLVLSIPRHLWGYVDPKRKSGWFSSVPRVGELVWIGEPNQIAEIVFDEDRIDGDW